MKSAIRLLLALPLVMMAGLVAPAVSTAAPQHVLKVTFDDLQCVFDTTVGDAVVFQASGDAGGATSWALVENSQGEALLWGEGGTATFGPDFAGDVTLFDLQGSAAGTLSVRLRITLGEPVVEQIEEREGNRTTKGSITTTDFAIEVVSATLPGYVIRTAADDCRGERTAFDLHSNNPHRHVANFDEFYSGRCDLDGIPMGWVALGGEGIDMPEFLVAIEDPVNPARAQGELSTEGGAKTRSGIATAPLVDPDTGTEVGDLSLALTLTRVGQQRSQKFVDGDQTDFVRWTPYDAFVEVTTTDGRVGRVHCPAYSLHVSRKHAGE